MSNNDYWNVGLIFYQKFLSGLLTISFLGLLINIILKVWSTIWTPSIGALNLHLNLRKVTLLLFWILQLRTLIRLKTSGRKTTFSSVFTNLRFFTFSNQVWVAYLTHYSPEAKRHLKISDDKCFQYAITASLNH